MVRKTRMRSKRIVSRKTGGRRRSRKTGGRRRSRKNRRKKRGGSAVPTTVYSMINELGKIRIKLANEKNSEAFPEGSDDFIELNTILVKTHTLITQLDASNNVLIAEFTHAFKDIKQRTNKVLRLKIIDF